MCIEPFHRQCFSMTVLLVTNLKSRNGKTSKTPEVLMAANISSDSRFSWRGLFSFCFFMSFRVCTSHFFYPPIDRFFSVCLSNIVFYVCVVPKQDITPLNPAVLIGRFISIRQKYATAFSLLPLQCQFGPFPSTMRMA